MDIHFIPLIHPFDTGATGTYINDLLCKCHPTEIKFSTARNTIY